MTQLIFIHAVLVNKILVLSLLVGQTRMKLNYLIEMIKNHKLLKCMMFPEKYIPSTCRIKEDGIAVVVQMVTWEFTS